MIAFQRKRTPHKTNQEQLNQSMRDWDKMKDDAIAHSSDQLVAITGI